MKRTLNFEKMKVTPKENWGGCLTKGKEYEVVKEVSDNYVITDDSGCQIGWKQDRFNVIKEDAIFDWDNPELDDKALSILEDFNKKLYEKIEPDMENECIHIDYLHNAINELLYDTLKQTLIETI